MLFSKIVLSLWKIAMSSFAEVVLPKNSKLLLTITLESFCERKHRMKLFLPTYNYILRYFCCLWALLAVHSFFWYCVLLETERTKILFKRVLSELFDGRNNTSGLENIFITPRKSHMVWIHLLGVLWHKAIRLGFH